MRFQEEKQEAFENSTGKRKYRVGYLGGGTEAEKYKIGGTTFERKQAVFYCWKGGRHNQGTTGSVKSKRKKEQPLSELLPKVLDL